MKMRAASGFVLLHKDMQSLWQELSCVRKRMYSIDVDLVNERCLVKSDVVFSRMNQRLLKKCI